MGAQGEVGWKKAREDVFSSTFEGGVRICGDAVLRYFWCGFAVISILTCGIAISNH